MMVALSATGQRTEKKCRKTSDPDMKVSQGPACRRETTAADDCQCRNAHRQPIAKEKTQEVKVTYGPSLNSHVQND